MSEIGTRIFNLFFSSILIVFLFPILLIVSIAIVIDSPGKPILRQKRVGKDQNIFLMYKFRTMKFGAEREYASLKKFSISDGPVFRMSRDPRETRVGKFLRIGIDELPQLINILRGEMNLVGPRPFIVEESSRIDPKYNRRFSVNPGMASEAVLNVKRHSSFDSWMRSDLDYVKRKSVFLDIIILLNTFRLVLKSVFHIKEKV